MTTANKLLPLCATADVRDDQGLLVAVDDLVVAVFRSAIATT